MNSLASSSSTFTSAVSSITTTQVSNIVSTSVARTISNATATRISVVASAVVVATCTAVTQLPPTDAQVTPEVQTSTVYEVEHEISIQEVPVIQESIVYVPSEVVSTVHDTSIIHDVSTVYDTSIIENTVTEISTVYVEKPPKDYSVYHYEEDDMFKYKVYDNANEAEIVKVETVPENMEETWILPDTFNDIPVTKIGREVFAWKNIPSVYVNIKSVPENIKIGENVEEIRRGAFMDCNSLKNIELNDKITEIAPKTFNNCRNLETVTGGKNVETIEEYAFASTYSLKSVDFGSLKTIEDNAFEGCTIEEIVFSDSIEYIGDFSYPTADTVTVYVNTEKAEKEPDIYKQIGDILCNAKTVNIIFTGNAVKYSGARYNLMEELFDWSIGDEQILNVSFEDSIEEIDNGAFYDCNTLKEITLPKNLRSVGDNVFGQCTSLEKVTLNEGLQFIGNEAFWGCSALESINIPDSVKEIGDYTFENCFALQNITLSDGLETIGDMTFCNCESLKKITIPSSVVKIGEDAFYGTDCTICGISGSYAQQYAEEHNMKFVSTESENDL